MKYTLLLLIICLSISGQTQDIAPKKGSGSKFSITCANIYYEVDSTKAARVTSFKLDGSEILYLDFATTDNAGSTFWPSPQSIWNWPPPTNLDNAPFSSTIQGNKITFKGNFDSQTQLRFYKTIYASTVDTSITIEYTIKNERSTAKSWAPWEITRVIANGLSLFAVGSGSVTGDMKGRTKTQNGYVWYDQDNTASISGSKFFCDGKGWLAHVVNGNMLFIKKFDDLAAGKAAPAEAEVEMYTDPTHAYTELENQGAYVSIASKDSLTWTVKWYARKLPASINVSIGSSTLTNYIANIVGSSPSSSVKNSFDSNVKVFPNPASSMLIIESSLISYNDVNISIYDMQGRNVLKQALNQDQQNVNIEKLVQGNYIYKLQQGNNSIAQGQFELIR